MVVDVEEIAMQELPGFPEENPSLPSGLGHLVQVQKASCNEPDTCLDPDGSLISGPVRQQGPTLSCKAAAGVH
jgi:hypothetical protein